MESSQGSDLTFTDNVESAVASQDQVQSLLKALETGQGADPTAFTGGSSLRMQSLDGTLKNVTFNEKHLKAVKEIPTRQAYSTVEEYTQETGYGETEGAFVNEIENPEEADAELARKFTVVKYMRTLRKVSDVSGMVKNIQEPINVQTIAGTRFLLRRLEENIFLGNSSVVVQEFDGIETIIKANEPTHIIDLRNAEMGIINIQDQAQRIADNFGSATHLFTSHGVQSSLDKSLEPDQRVILPMNPQQGWMVGTPAAGARTSFGDVAFRPDVFIKEGKVKPTAAVGVGAPGAPTIVLATVTDATSLFDATTAGTYTYAVTAVNSKGESAPSAESGIDVADGEHVTVAVTQGTGISTGYILYRNDRPTSSVLRQYLRVAKASSPETFIDRDFDIPGTSKAFLTDIDTMYDTISVKKLAPLTKLPLARVGAFVQWLQNLYVTLQITAPKKFVVYKNVKASAVV